MNDAWNAKRDFPGYPKEWKEIGSTFTEDPYPTPMWAWDDPDMVAEWDRMIAEEAALGRKIEALSRGYREAWEQVARFAATLTESDWR